MTELVDFGGVRWVVTAKTTWPIVDVGKHIEGLYIYKGAIVFVGILLVQFCILMKVNLHVQLWF